jgi:MoaA/NifB/PqqE/SkfB family radical SAM enzyme
MKNFDDAPFLVIWELTQACDLACVHCRACAVSIAIRSNGRPKKDFDCWRRSVCLAIH